MRKIIVVLAALAVLLPAAAFAKPQISVSVTAEKEMSVIKDGQKTTKRVAADKINPGDVIFYTLTYVNAGDEAATNAVLDDPIPQGTVYLPGSAYGAGAEITFSIDGGTTFKKPSLLTYEFRLPNGKAEKKAASPEEYTHIRCVIGRINPGAKGQVGFQVKVKRD